VSPYLVNLGVVRRLSRYAFKFMNDTLAGTEEGIVNHDGFGKFRVKKFEMVAN
jgi:hypothetical protein